MKELLDRVENIAAIEPACWVLALGSPHGDDRAPWLVADRLMDLNEFAVSVFKLSSPFEIISHINSSMDLIVIDVCVSGAPLGTVLRFDQSNLGNLSTGVRTSHGGSLFESVELAGALGRRPRSLCVLAVEMGPHDATLNKTDVSDHCVEPLLAQLILELWNREHRNNRFGT